MGLLEQYYARRADSDLRKKVESAVLRAAYAVITEAAEYPNHATRLTWAKGVRINPSTLAASVDQALLVCLDNPTIGANPEDATDNDVQFVVNSTVDPMAGVGG